MACTRREVGEAAIRTLMWLFLSIYHWLLFSLAKLGTAQIDQLHTYYAAEWFKWSTIAAITIRRLLCASLTKLYKLLVLTMMQRTCIFRFEMLKNCIKLHWNASSSGVAVMEEKWRDPPASFHDCPTQSLSTPLFPISFVFMCKVRSCTQGVQGMVIHPGGAR